MLSLSLPLSLSIPVPFPYRFLEVGLKVLERLIQLAVQHRRCAHLATLDELKAAAPCLARAGADVAAVEELTGSHDDARVAGDPFWAQRNAVGVDLRQRGSLFRRNSRAGGAWSMTLMTCS